MTHSGSHKPAAQKLPIPVIVGPTAGGKTSLALKLARTLTAMGYAGAEIISADAFQIYRHMDIGTAKPSQEEQGGIKHWLIDIVDPGEAFTVNDWLVLAEAAVTDIQSRGQIPIVVGGTHLYAKAFLDGLFEGPEPNPQLRAKLSELSNEELRTWLCRIDPEKAALLHQNDRRRTIRAIEVHEQTGKPISEHQKQWDRVVRTDRVLIWLDWQSQEINPRINARVKQMVQLGLIDEVRVLMNQGVLAGQAAEALGYKQVIPALAGHISVDEAIEQIKIQTRRFAKNQRTWIRRLSIRPESLRVSCPWEDADNPAQTIANQLVRICGQGDSPDD